MASGVQGKIQEWEETGIAVVDGAAATIQTITIPNAASTCTITVKNTHATVAFDAFTVSVRSTENAPWLVHASAAADFTSPVMPMIDASGSPVALAAAASVQFRYDCSGLDAILLKASGDGAISEASVYYKFGVSR